MIAKAHLLAEHPLIGRPLYGRSEYREVIIRVLGGRYILQYRVADEWVVVLRVLHGRELRPDVAPE